MFTLMPYENSLVMLSMNGPQLKAVLERAYRNYYYYKYVPGYGGYSYYTTCMLDTNSVGRITYKTVTRRPSPTATTSSRSSINGKPVDFKNASKYYKVSTVNYLAAGSCNFNDNGVSLWPLNQIVNDTQYYVRDAVIDYITAQRAPISPAIEGRLKFVTDTTSLQASVNEFYSNGQITKASVRDSLLAQLVAAQKSIDAGKLSTAVSQLNAFISLVQAQSGKAITKRAADLLIADAQSVIGTLK